MVAGAGPRAAGVAPTGGRRCSLGRSALVPRAAGLALTSGRCCGPRCSNRPPVELGGRRLVAAAMVAETATGAPAAKQAAATGGRGRRPRPARAQEWSEYEEAAPPWARRDTMVCGRVMADDCAGDCSLPGRRWREDFISRLGQGKTEGELERDERSRVGPPGTRVVSRRRRMPAPESPRADFRDVAMKVLTEHRRGGKWNTFVLFK
jgi:hypothetical protein